MIETLGWIATAVVVGSFGIQDVKKLLQGLGRAITYRN